jgi:chromosome segregation ATPase
LLHAFELSQSTPDISEGLPFWLLWFLLLIILLLLMFIFLRDKDLRRRISLFLSGARRHMSRLRLQVKLRKERDKKIALWKELGKTAWHEDIRTPSVEAQFRKLAGIEEEIGRLQKTWHDVYSRIEALGREHEAAIRSFRSRVAELEKARRPDDEKLRALLAKRNEVREALEATLRELDGQEALAHAAGKEIREIEAHSRLGEAEKAERIEKAREKAEGLSSRIRSFREKTPLLEEERRHLDLKIEEVEARIKDVNDRILEAGEEQKELLRTQEREIRDWQKNKERLQDRIVENKRLMEPLFEDAGRALDEARVENEELDVVYFQIDSVNRAVAELESRIEHLK